MRFAVLALAALTTACPGLEDYVERIGDTQYNFSRTGANVHWVMPRDECDLSCPVIWPNVVRFDWNDAAIAVRRQVINVYQCDGESRDYERLNRYEQYVILLASNRLVGPMTVAQYREYQNRNAALLDGIALLDEDNMFDGDGKVLSTLKHCVNPVKIET
jgi:hypothetical protein